MEKYLEFFEKYQEKQSYWQLDNINQDTRIEVMWISKDLWRYRKLNDIFWFETNTKNIINELEKLQADVYEFEIQLRQKIVEIIIAAHHLCKAGRNLFGDDYVDRMIQEYESFFEQLLKTIDQVLKEKQKEKFTIINGGEISASEKFTIINGGENKEK